MRIHINCFILIISFTLIVLGQDPLYDGVDEDIDGEGGGELADPPTYTYMDCQKNISMATNIRGGSSAGEILRAFENCITNGRDLYKDWLRNYLCASVSACQTCLNTYDHQTQCGSDHACHWSVPTGLDQGFCVHGITSTSTSF